ncbi:AraC family transcriptional regulator [Paenibacillus sp. 2TAB23]|uniref:AraC family transcriptional regulator n=1 Tax=Paenibacillus sp. 2TAB23 TaxID=3233004 RepID=UPI003F9696CE
MVPFNLPGDLELHGSFPFTFKIHKLTTDIPPHTHNFIEYTFVIFGRGIEIINGVERNIQAGTFTLLLPHQVHQLKIHPGEELHLYIGAIGLQALFGSDESAAALHELLLRSGMEGDPSYALSDMLIADLLPLFANMHAEVQSSQAWSQLMFKTKLMEVLIILNRYVFRINDVGTVIRHVNKKGKIREVILYVYQNYREDISLVMLAERFHLSVPHISASFRLFSGDNFHSFLEKIRISHACSLLVSSIESVTVICYEVGFSSYSTFCRVFQARLGMSATSYRKLYQNM